MFLTTVNHMATEETCSPLTEERLIPRTATIFIGTFKSSLPSRKNGTYRAGARIEHNSGTLTKMCTIVEHLHKHGFHRIREKLSN